MGGATASAEDLGQPASASAEDEASGSGAEPHSAVVLVDFDNLAPGELTSREQLEQDIRRLVDCALDASPRTNSVDVRFYGGWLEDGVLTRRASDLQSRIGPRSFAVPHPRRSGILRITVVLVTRLAAVPDVEWRHTLRSSAGLPQLRLAEKPRPQACADGPHCPIALMHRMSRRRRRVCPTVGCTVNNEMAFLVREQKMVDALMNCDAISYAGTSSLVAVLSNDLDVLPGVALAAAQRGPDCDIVLIRPSPRSKTPGLYDEALTTLGVTTISWESA